ncbi:type IV secretion protein Rhs [Capsulimonas corticalis]|uniref:Type IV secretion protein Rhs n=1 Tax=Capsulimonas corticalis TaxID=2219043 RepID=A0A402CWS6_9BACT|nr:VgrG-related protein [Capsulimonas corticalis]BDI34267.1 type IV secretion protein Rhs [Capsulimonas corticalis]
MANADPSHLSHFDLKLNGKQEPEVLKAMLDCTVENSLHLPDLCTVRLHDDGFVWLDSDKVKEGVTVEILAGEENVLPLKTIFQGEVTALEMDLAAHGSPTLILRCSDRSHRLHRGRKSRSFVQAKDTDIVKKVAEEDGFTVHADNTSQVHEWVFQNNQTNWEFLTERAAYNGFRLFVQGEKDLYFQKVQDQGTSSLTIEWGKDLRSFRPRTSAGRQVSEVVVRGWDPKTKQPIVGSSKTPTGVPQIGDSKTGGEIASKAFGAAKMVVADRPIHSQAEADDLARSVCDDLGGSFVEAEGLCFGQPTLKPGMMVEIKNIGKRFSGKYQVSETTHVYTPAEGFSTMFSISGKNPATLLGLLQGDGNGKRASMGGNIVVGLVTDNVDPENLGRVKVKYPWLTEDHTSYWARQSAPMAGSGRGFYFLPEVDDEVLVAFEHGDIRRPYIIGALWNGKDKPVEGNSKAISGGKVNRRTIQTRIGHTVLLDDTDGKGEMRLTTAGGHHLTLNDKEKNITAQTTSGHKIVLDDSGDKIEIVDRFGANKITISSMDQSISMTCLGDFSVTAAGNISLTSAQQLSVTAAMGINETTPAMMTQSIGGVLTQTVGGAVTQSVGGALTIQSAGAAVLTVGGAAAVTAGGAIAVTAPTIPVTGLIINNGVPIPIP